MRTIRRLRNLEVLTGISEGAYEVNYTYDVKGRVTKETVTGTLERVTSFTYDSEDNVATEVIIENGKTITKTYTYDPKTKDITKVQVTVA